MTFTADMGAYVGRSVPAFIESETLNQIANHSIARLADSLLGYDLLQRLDPELDDGQSALILGAASNQISRSIEEMISAVSRTLVSAADFFDGVSLRSDHVV